MKQDSVLIFTDAATSPQLGTAIGVFVCMNEEQFYHYGECSEQELNKKIANQIIYKTYVSKQSTRSEIETVIEALHYIKNNYEPVIAVELYTDCQSVCDLLGKRGKKLKQNHFVTRTGKLLKNAECYKKLFSIADQFSIRACKVKGHQSKRNHLTLHEKIFAVIDKLGRKKLRTLKISS